MAEEPDLFSEEKVMTVNVLGSASQRPDGGDEVLHHLTNGKEWFTVDELAELTGLSVETLRKGDSPLGMLGLDFQVESKIQNFGGHVNRRVYSESVLKALKQYQLRNAAPNALKDKGTAIAGNVSMTVKELAEALNVDRTTITKTVNRLEKGDEVLHHLTNDKFGNEVWIFDERQATLIKQEVQRHHNLANRDIDSATTDYEMEILTQKVIQYHVQKAAEYKKRAEVAEGALKRIEDATGCFSIAQAAKALRLPYGRNTLFKELQRMNLLNAHNEPYQEQIAESRFRVVSKVCGDGKCRPVPLVTGKGLVFLAKKFNAEIDGGVESDA